MPGVWGDREEPLRGTNPLACRPGIHCCRSNSSRLGMCLMLWASGTWASAMKTSSQHEEALTASLGCGSSPPTTDQGESRMGNVVFTNPDLLARMVTCSSIKFSRRQMGYDLRRNESISYDYEDTFSTNMYAKVRLYPHDNQDGILTLRNRKRLSRIMTRPSQCSCILPSWPCILLWLVFHPRSIANSSAGMQVSYAQRQL